MQYIFNTLFDSVSSSMDGSPYIIGNYLFTTGRMNFGDGKLIKLYNAADCIEPGGYGFTSEERIKEAQPIDTFEISEEGLLKALKVIDVKEGIANPPVEPEPFEEDKYSAEEIEFADKLAIALSQEERVMNPDVGVMAAQVNAIYGTVKAALEKRRELLS